MIGFPPESKPVVPPSGTSPWNRPWTFRAAEPAPWVSMTTGRCTGPFASLKSAFSVTEFAWDVTMGFGVGGTGGFPDRVETFDFGTVVSKLDNAKIGAPSGTKPVVIWDAQWSIVPTKEN